MGVLAAGSMGTTATERALAVAPPTAQNCPTPTSLQRASATPAANTWTTTTSPGGITSTITVAPGDVPAGAVVRDVDVQTFISSRASGDVQVAISHGGKTVRLVGAPRPGSRRTWDSLNDLWNGSTFDDQATRPVMEGGFTANGSVGNVAPDGKLAAFNGMSPAGAWTVTVTDPRVTEPPDDPTLPPPSEPQDGGTFQSWALTLTASPDSAEPPLSTVQTFGTTGGAVAIPDGPAGATVERPIVVTAAAGQRVRAVELVTNTPHDFPNDLRISLVSPTGTELVMTPGGGQLAPNPGAIVDWKDEAALSLSQAPSESARELQPQMALSRFVGLEAAGTWKVRVRDRFAEDTGTFTSATLRLRTSAGCVVTPPPDTTTPPPVDGGTTTPPPATTPPPVGTPTANPPAPPPTIGVRLLGRNFSVTRGGLVRARVRLTRVGQVTVQLRRGKKVVRRVVVRGKVGTNIVPLRVVRVPGRYQLLVTVKGANGATSRATGVVTIRRR